MSETKVNFNNYEIMYIVDDQNKEQADLLKKEFIEILTQNNGKITKEQDFIRPFAYKINHKTSGHYFVFQLNTTSENIAAFNRIFSIKQKQQEVIRKLVINLDDEKTNTFKDRKESVKKQDFYSRDQNRDSKVKNLNYPRFEARQNFDKKVEEANKKEDKIEDSSKTVKENPKESK